MSAIPKVSIIVPIYKVEQTIECCARSIFEQSFKEIEYIFVNDCSPDNSVQKLKKIIDLYPERKINVTIINHDANKGVAAARNTGLNNATTEYFLFVDSDDWVESNMIDELYSNAVLNDSDIVWCDFYVNYPNNLYKTVYRKQNIFENSKQCINEILAGTLHAGLWNKLMKRNICITNNIRFPEGINMCEDIVFSIFFLLIGERNTYIPTAYYHYMQYPKSITNKRTRQSFESEINAVNILVAKLSPSLHGKHLLIYQARIKRNMFFSGLFSNSEYYNCFPESIRYIYSGLNLIDKIAIWLSLQKKFRIARGFLFFGQIYSRLKQISGKN